MKRIQIAIDGDASSGKTTVGKIVAKRLGYEFIDSGLFYRLATYLVIKEGLLKEKRKWIDAAKARQISYLEGRIVLDGAFFDAELLRSREVEDSVSEVSESASIREFVTDLLRNIAEKRNVVMVGRDIGTVVLKNALLKVFLTATIEERARRRYNEFKQKGKEMDFEEVKYNIEKRDMIDSSRRIAPLSIAEDAFVIDTTGMTVEEVVSKVITFLEGRKYALRVTARNRKDSI